MPRNNLISIIAGLTLVASACGSTGESASTTEPPSAPTTVALGGVPSDYDGYFHQPTACGAEKPSPATAMEFDAPGDAGVTEPTEITLNTSCGSIVILLDPEVAPETVNSFVFLAESGYFDGTASHRVIPDFMIQMGDPTATGRGGPGYFVADEFPEPGTVYSRGLVAMANAGPGTTGSQFFIMLATAEWLPPQYTVIGSVSSGMEALDRIAAVPLGRSPSSADPTPSTPLESVYIDSASVQR